MKRIEPLSLVLSLTLAVGLMGWIVWSQRPAAPVAHKPVLPAPSPTAPVQELPPVDAARVAELRAVADNAPEDVQVRVDLGYLYLEARRFEDAVPWFEVALALNPDQVDVSTDLGVAYYYVDDIDRALSQFARSLEMAPTDAETLLKFGIVLAFGGQDLEGAIEAWEEVQRVAPGSPEALAATEALEQLRVAHP
jgi:tetratricopeptide (TPR) repeat protein